MDHIQGLSRDQLTLFPEALDDYISEENPVRFIDAFVISSVSVTPSCRRPAARLTILPICSSSTSTATSIGCAPAGCLSAKPIAMWK